MVILNDFIERAYKLTEALYSHSNTLPTVTTLHVPMPQQTATRSTSRKVKMTVLGPNSPRTTTAGLLQIRQDRLDTERELDMQAQHMCFCYIL